MKDDDRLLVEDGITDYGNLMTYSELRIGTYTKRWNVLMELKILAKQLDACGDPQAAERVREAIVLIKGSKKDIMDGERPPYDEPRKGRK